jgi:hypothetical protein
MVEYAPCKRVTSVRFRPAPKHCLSWYTFMLHKTRQFTLRYRFTPSNRLPLKRARHYLTSRLRAVRSEKPSAHIRAAIGLIR